MSTTINISTSNSYPKTDRRKVEKALKLYDSQTHSVAEITEATNVTKATLYRAIKDRETAK